MKRLTLVTVLLLVATAIPALADSHLATSTLPNGTPIEATIDDPVDGTEIVVPVGESTADVTVSGTASVGNSEPDTTLVYVIDVSFSVNMPALGDCGGDLNGDGIANSILDCQLAGVLALNEAAIATGAVDEVGVAIYGESGAVADMTPDGGDDPITAPDAGIVPGDVNTVVTSVVSPWCVAGVRQFTNKVVGCGFTNFSDGLAAATSIVEASTNSRNVVFFLSDGLSNRGSGTFDANLAALGATGATVHTFAVGSGSSCLGGSAGTLQEIGSDTGGTCTEVISPADLPDTIPDLFSSSLDSLVLSVDGAPAAVIPNTDLPLPQDGPVAVDYSTLVPGLAPGAHTFCVTAQGSDATGAGESGPACVEVNLLQIDLQPKYALNVLGTGDDTHTVTATIAGADGTLDGRVVTFTVTSGPNAGVTGTCDSTACTTDATGAVSWTYAGKQGLGAAGVDIIEACFTVSDPTGATGCDTAEKEWGDTDPPISACLPGPNPHGKKIPPAGSSSLPGPKGGQNEDGFYELDATDAVDPAPEIFVVDGGSGTVFGPFADGTVIKWTQAPGAAPATKKMGSTNGQAEAVPWHLRGTGDMSVYAVDASGNMSDLQTCLVPPLPK